MRISMLTKSRNVAAVAIFSFALSACSKVEYDYKALGFSDKAEMESAFEKGYHTRQKLLEMMQQTEKFDAAPTPVPQQLQSEISVPTTQESTNVVEMPKTETAPSKDVADASTCYDIRMCVNAMLASAKVENVMAAMDASRRIDSFDKPLRGDRKQARKLNEDGLTAFKQGKNADAISLLTKAHEMDRLDEEILSNLVYVYSEDENHSKAISIATEGFILNPRRASLWMPYAQANAKLGNQAIALQSMWLAWQFSANKEKMLASIDKKIADEQDATVKLFYTTSKSWLIENKKPNL